MSHRELVELVLRMQRGGAVVDVAPDGSCDGAGCGEGASVNPSRCELECGTGPRRNTAWQPSRSFLTRSQSLDVRKATSYHVPRAPQTLVTHQRQPLVTNTKADEARALPSLTPSIRPSTTGTPFAKATESQLVVVPTTSSTTTTVCILACGRLLQAGTRETSRG